MVIEEPKTMEVRFHGINTKSFFNKEFIDLLDQEIPNLKFEHFCIYTEDKDNEDKKDIRIIIGQPRTKTEKKDILDVYANKPEVLEKLIKIIKEYNK